MLNYQHAIRLSLLGALAALSTINFSYGQDQNDDSNAKANAKFVFVLTLNDSQIKALRVDGYLKSQVPKKLINRISAIKIQRETCFLDEVQTINSNDSRNGSALLLNVDESVVDRLEYQPVLMKIYNSGFSTVLLRHNWARKLIDETPISEVEPTKHDSNQLLIRINPNRAVLGYLKDSKVLSVRTDFGDIKIDTEKIQGIKFNVGPENKEIVVLKAGDTFSAQLDATNFTVKTRWGEKSLKVSDLDSVTSAINLKFVPDKKVQGQWRIQIMPLASPPQQSPR